MKFLANDWGTDLPVGWQDRSLITLVKPTDGHTFAPNVVVLRQPVAPRASVEEFAAEQRAAALAQIPDLQILDERAAKVAGAPAFQRLQRFASQGQMLQQAQTYVLRDSVVHVITCTATVAQFDACIPDFRHLVEWFSFSGAGS